MDAADRKKHPLFRGLMKYFPDALMAVSNVSYVANEQHNPGEPMHWAREKAKDHEDCIMRHLLESGTVDDDGLLHSAKVAWRALAMLQLELEKAQEKPTTGTYSAGEITMTINGKVIDPVGTNEFSYPHNRKTYGFRPPSY